MDTQDSFPIFCQIKIWCGSFDPFHSNFNGSPLKLNGPTSSNQNMLMVHLYHPITTHTHSDTHTHTDTHTDTHTHRDLIVDETKQVTGCNEAGQSNECIMIIITQHWKRLDYLSVSLYQCSLLLVFGEDPPGVSTPGLSPLQQSCTEVLFSWEAFDFSLTGVRTLWVWTDSGREVRNSVEKNKSSF